MLNDQYLTFYKILNQKNIYFFLFSALVLASPEVKIQMDSETMEPIDVEVKKLFETNSMVEEFMLLANISVAEKILEAFPDCAMLRRHPEPPTNNFDPLVKAGRHLVNTLHVLLLLSWFRLVTLLLYF